MSAPVKERIAWSDQHDESPAGAIDMQVILGELQYWWKFAVPVAVVLSLLAVGLVLLFAKPKYTASTWLIIREKPEYLLNPHVMEDPRKFVLNQMELLRSPPVIDPVANKPEVFAAPELASGDPAERLRRLLKVRAQGQSDFFVIEFTSEIPEKAALVVNGWKQPSPGSRSSGPTSSSSSNGSATRCRKRQRPSPASILTPPNHRARRSESRTRSVRCRARSSMPRLNMP
jgi:uncharacterized protein involved in exopolysaccharide biosynthesis